MSRFGPAVTVSAIYIAALIWEAAGEKFSIHSLPITAVLLALIGAFRKAPQ